MLLLKKYDRPETNVLQVWQPVYHEAPPASLSGA